MKLYLFTTARPGIGKYTIAKALAREYGFTICDNQLINNPILELLNYDGLMPVPEFDWEAIRKIRSSVFEFIANEKNNNYVLTNNLYEYEADRNLFAQVKQMAFDRGLIFVPVRLSITQEEYLIIVMIYKRRRSLKID